MEKTLTKENNEKIMISPYSKIKVYWDDRPENYSKESKIKIRNYFAKKYGVNKNNISVIYRPVKINERGETIEVTGASLENIMDVNYQRSLMKELIARDNKNIDFNRILSLDEKVNSLLDVDLDKSQHKTWSIRWLMINNFLSFGENNYLPISKLKGLTVVNSSPSNQGGKTTLIVDAIKFLLHGTTTKTDKNEEIFNTYSDKNELVVRGMLDIEGDEIIIERKMRRTPKKSGGWTVVNKVNYYELLPDGEEKELNEEDAKKTTIKIKESIGSEKDFEMLVLATEKTLDDLIGLTTSESGKVLSRLIGLEVLEMKEEIVRGLYNDFNKKKKSNSYDVITLTSEITDHNDKIVKNLELLEFLKNNLETSKLSLTKLRNEYDTLVNSKEKIDVSLTTLNPSKLEEEITALTVKGKSLKVKVGEYEENILTLKDIVFDENKHYLKSKEYSKLISDKAVVESNIIRLNNIIKSLIEGGFCQSCNRKLDNVDNTEHINKHEAEVYDLKTKLENIEHDILNVDILLKELNEIKNQIERRNRLELEKDRLEVEIGSLRNQVVFKMNELKKYKLNLGSIEHNKKIDILLDKIKTDILVQERYKDETILKIERVSNEVEQNRVEIVNKEKLIEIIKKEEEIEKIFKVYIELVGKRGINKLVLRSVLPIINSEIERLLDGVCDFEVEIYIDEKNDVQFLITKDGKTKLLKSGSGFEKTASSLALRTVLSKMSTLPMPNFIAFDEVLGKVAPDNMDNIKSLFDRMKDMFDNVFLITHSDMIKDWGDNIITVNKLENISSVVFK